MYQFAVLVVLPALVFCQVDIFQLANSQFDKLDLNQDGNIQPLEPAQYFSRFDTNHDQQISRTEFQRKVDADHASNPATHDVLTRLFDALDYNNDQHLSQVDYDELFRTGDQNKNHLIDQREFRTLFYDLTGISGA